MKNNKEVVNQIFLGIPWKNIKNKYINARNTLNKKYPLSFLIMGRDENKDAENLLDEIKDSLRKSNYAIFDATYGNPNVSLEFGFAEGIGLNRLLYVNQNRASQTDRKDKPIISDLAGKTYSAYKNEHKLLSLLESFSKKHNYTIRFDRFIRKQRTSAGKKKRLRALALKIIHTLDEKESLRKTEIAQRLIDEKPDAYRMPEIINAITILKKNRLLGCKGGGPNPDYWIE